MEVGKSSEPPSIGGSIDENRDNGCSQSIDGVQRNDDPSSSSQPRHQSFILGHCESRGNIVEWMEFDDQGTAYEHFYVIKTFLRHSVVLFEDLHRDSECETSEDSYRDDVDHIPIMTSGQHHIDVAVILSAFQIRKEQTRNCFPASTSTTSTAKASSVEEFDARLLHSSKRTTPNPIEFLDQKGWVSRIVPEFPMFKSALNLRTSRTRLSRRRSGTTKLPSIAIRCDNSLDMEDTSTSDVTVVDRDEIEQRVRDGDAPVVPPSRSWIEQFLLKRCVDMLFHRHTVAFFAAGPRRMTSLYSFPLRTYPNVLGHVALTIDDAPSRFGPRNSQLDAVRELLAEYDAKATFMVVGKFVTGHEQQMVQLLEEGHEFGNHGISDQAHHKFDSDNDFLEALDSCNTRIENLQRQQQLMTLNKSQALQPVGVRYFRAPHGKYTKRMEELVQSRNMVNVMCDAYAADPIVEDGDYIARSLTRQARDGGILLIHIPERGFRDYCLVALKGLLEGLKRRKLKVVSVGMLEALAKRGT
jgi:peptidoglycan/xylan/chitin deacetylase (PgdA/CDA1 family)